MKCCNKCGTCWQYTQAPLFRGPCPVCEVKRLQGEVDRLQQQYAELYAATWLCPMDEAVENRQEGHAETIAEITVDVADAYNWREHREFEPAREANAND